MLGHETGGSITPNSITPSPIAVNRHLGEGWWLLEAEAPHLASRCRAGQFIQVRIGEGDDPLVRRPFSVYDVGPTLGAGATTLRILYQVVGPGTRWMARLAPGDGIDLLGPLGNPFPALPVAADGTLFLVGGGIGVAPLYFYCRQLADDPRAPSHQVLLGARRASLLVGREAFEELEVATHCSTDDGSTGLHGNVVQLLELQREELGGAPVAGIGCGPHGMNVALRDYAVAQDIEFWISLENYMPCGFGACFGCVIEIPGTDPPRYRRVCVEGPAFPVSEIPTQF